MKLYTLTTKMTALVVSTSFPSYSSASLPRSTYSTSHIFKQSNHTNHPPWNPSPLIREDAFLMHPLPAFKGKWEREGGKEGEEEDGEDIGERIPEARRHCIDNSLFVFILFSFCLFFVFSLSWRPAFCATSAFANS